MRADLLARIERERARQFDLPGIEFDVRNTCNDWTTIAAHYLLADVRRGPIKPRRDHYEDGLVKAAAVILAALEHCPRMEASHQFSKDEPG